MKKTLLASAALVALAVANPSLAADLGTRMPVKAPPVVAPVALFTWTGCYVGGHVGGGWGQKHLSIADSFGPRPILPFSDRVDGFVGGGQIGCDYQFAPNWVVGLEGDGSWTDIKGNELHNPFFAGKSSSATFSARTDWLVTVTGRLGFAWNRWLLYGKGGAAWARDKYSLAGFAEPGVGDGLPFVLNANETRAGWTVGGGVEYAFLGNWSAKLEYNFMEFGNRPLSFVGTESGGFLSRVAAVDQQIHVLKFGINYRFGWGKPPAPIAPKY